MPISSMTGFARASGERQGLFWQWEIKSVNGKALDVRLKLPPGFEALEPPVRAALAAAFKRGNLQVSLTISGQVGREALRLNQDILDRLVAAGGSRNWPQPPAITRRARRRPFVPGSPSRCSG